MKRYSNDCVGCAAELGCRGNSCPNRHVPHYYCDECGGEFSPDELYIVEDEWYCEDCLKEHLQKVSDLEDEDQY